MTRRQAILGLILAISWPFYGHGEVLSISQFGGLDTDSDPLVTKVDRSPDSQDVKTDETLGLAPRDGYVQFSTEPSSKKWVFPVSNGDRYLITLSSFTLKATRGSTNFTIILGTVNSNVPVAATAFGNKFYWYSSDGGKYWDTTVTVATNTAYNFTQLVSHKGRCWGSGVTGNERTIYVSKYNTCADFTLRSDPTEEDPTTLQVQGALDENVTTLYASYRGGVVWMKNSSFGVITGSKRSTFVSTDLSDNVGSSYPDTVQDCDGKLRFLGTKRTVWQYSPEGGLENLTKGKENIQTLMNSIAQGDANARSWTQTTAADWGAGLVGPKLDTTTVAGDISFIPDTALTFGALMTAGNGTWTTSTTLSSVAYGTWTFYGDFTEVDHTSPNFSYDAVNEFNFIMTATGTTTPPDEFPASGNQSYLNPGYKLRIGGGRKGGCSTPYQDNAFFEFSAGTAAANTASAFQRMGNRYCFNYSGSFYPKISVERSSTGTFTLKLNDAIALTMVDTKYTSSTYMGFVANIAGTNGGCCAAINNIYITSAVVNSNLTSISTFTSQVYNVGTAITSWGLFNVGDTANGGNILYQIYSSTSPVISISNANTYTGKQLVSNGSIPTVATGPYVAIYATFTRTVGSQTPTLSNFTIGWNEGSRINVPSVWALGRYMMGVSISSTGNNVTMVYDRNQQWQKWSIPMDAAIIYNSDPYFGNASGIYKFGVGNNDNGAAIPSYYRTKRFMPGGPNYNNTYYELYTTVANSAATLQTSYYLNGINTALPMPSRTMNAASGIQDYYIPFADTYSKQGRAIEFLWTVSATTSWRILAGNLYFTKDLFRTGN